MNVAAGGGWLGRRIGVGLMMTTALAGGMATTPAFAQAPPAAAQAAERDFNIAPQSLTTALAQFGQQSGVQITADGDMVRNLSTPGVQDRMTPAQALQRLLAGTGLTYSIASNGTFALQKAVSQAGSNPNTIQLGTVRVEGQSGPPSTSVLGNVPPPYAGGQVATGGQLGMLGNKSVMDTPFNQTNYTSELIKNQQARTINDVLTNDPSVTNTYPRGGGIDVWNIRGFKVSNAETAYGGMYGILPNNSISAQLAERVEVLKGPNAFLNGMAPQGDVGATINIVPKRAGDQPIADLTPTYLSNGEFGGTVDLGQRFGKDKEFGVRFNGLYQDGDTNVSGTREMWGLGVLGLDYQGNRFRVSADFGRQEHDINGDQQLGLFASAGVAIPHSPNPSKDYLPSWFTYNNTDTFGMVQGEYDISDRWTAYGAVGARRNDNEGITGAPTLTSSSGAFTVNPTFGRGWTETRSEMAGLRGQFDTGPISHAVNFNYTNFDLDSGTVSQFPFPAITSNIYSPIAVPNPNLALPSAVPKTAFTGLASYAASDTASILHDRVQLTFGERQQDVGAKNYNATTGAVTSSYSASALSPFVGLVLKPWENVSLYGNYIEGLSQGAIAPVGTTNVGQVFAPYQTAQYETGVKVDWGALTTTVSLFQISKPSAYTNPATLTYVQDGNQRNRGVEFNVFGKLTDTVRILGGVAYTDAILVNTAGGNYDGKVAPGVPKFNLVLGGEWDTPFAHGLTLTARANHLTSQYYDNANTQSIPGWTRVDIGARYVFQRPNGMPITVRADIENVFNTSYWQSAGGSQITAAQPRTYLLSTTFSF